MSDLALVRLDHLGRTYPDGRVNALRDVSLEIPPGQYVAVMGPSGSGKSTLLNLVGGLDRPSQGEVIFSGQSLSSLGNLDYFRARKIGFVFQAFYLLPTLNAVENVQIPMFETELSASGRARKALELLSAVGMEHRLHHLPPQLSVGERQRVALARALANDPVLLLADEPTGNLDTQTAAEILDLLANLHRQQGMTLIVVTHSPEVAARAERLIRLRDGRVVEDQMLNGEEERASTSPAVRGNGPGSRPCS